MHLDVIELRNFYYRTKLGRMVQRYLQAQICALWPNTKGQTVVGYGFACALLRPFLGQSRRVINLMPGAQGVMHWPPGAANHSVLVPECRWPIETGKIDRLIIMHGLETSDDTPALLDEIWRVMGPGGRVLFIVPNRAGLWARRDVTPFGHGRPYSVSQLELELSKHRFICEKNLSALYAPPSHRQFWLRSAGLIEKTGQKIGTPLSAGVVMIEATKQVYAPKRPGLRESVRNPLKALEGIAKPAGKPVSGDVIDIASGRVAGKNRR